MHKFHPHKRIMTLLILCAFPFFFLATVRHTDISIFPFAHQVGLLVVVPFCFLLFPTNVFGFSYSL